MLIGREAVPYSQALLITMPQRQCGCLPSQQRKAGKGGRER